MNILYPRKNTFSFVLTSACLAFLFTSSGAAYGKTFDVLNYGGKGDGTTDDQKAITSTLAAAKSAGVGNTVLFQAKHTFLHSGMIIVPSNVNLTGVDSTSKLLASTISGAVQLASNSSLSKVCIAYVNSSPGSSPQGAGVWLHAARLASVSQITVGQTAGDGIYADQSTGTIMNNAINNSKLSLPNAGIHLFNCGLTGPFVRYSYTVEELKVVNNNVTVNGTGILAESCLTGAVYNNVIDGRNVQLGAGIEMSNCTMPSPVMNQISNVPLAGLLIHGSMASGIWLAPQVNGSYNILKNCGNSSSAAYICSDNALSTSYILIYDQIGPGKGDGYNVAGSPSSMIIIEGDTLHDLQNNGIKCSGAWDTVAVNNIKNIGEAAIDVTGRSFVSIASNQLANIGMNDKNPPAAGFHNAAIEARPFDIKSANVPVSAVLNNLDGPVNGLKYFIYDCSKNTVYKPRGNTTHTLLPSYFP